MIVDQKEFISRGARYFRNKLAFVYKGGNPSLIEGRGLTFAQVNDRACALANHLMEQGFKPGTRVATLVHNSLEYPEIQFALMKGGFPQVILNPMLSGGRYSFRSATLRQRYSFYRGAMLKWCGLCEIGYLR